MIGREVQIGCFYKLKETMVGKIAYTLVIIGGLNWGLIGLLDYDLVAVLFDAASGISRVVYSLVGLSALWMLFAGRR